MVPYGPIGYKSALVQILAWCIAGDNPLSEPMMALFSYAYMRLSASMNKMAPTNGV